MFQKFECLFVLVICLKAAGKVNANQIADISGRVSLPGGRQMIDGLGIVFEIAVHDAHQPVRAIIRGCEPGDFSEVMDGGDVGAQIIPCAGEPAVGIDGVRDFLDEHREGISGFSESPGAIQGFSGIQQDVVSERPV